MTTLKQALKDGKLDQFIAEREAEQGDPEAFNRAVQAMAESKAVPKHRLRAIPTIEAKLASFTYLCICLPIREYLR
jgi:hypothetical protein